MRSKIKLEINKPSELAGDRSLLAGLLVLIPLIAAFFYGVVGKDKFPLISPLSILGYGCLAAWMLRAALSRHSTSVAPSGFVLFLVFVVYGVVVGLFSAIPYEARLRMLEVGLLVGAYYVWSNSLALFRRSRTVLGWLMLFALLSCFYGLVNFFKQPEMVLWVERHAPYVGRLASTYICPNHFAHLLQMLLPFCLAVVLIPRAGWLLRILAGYCIVVFIPTICLTESRAGMLGSVVALGVTICLLALRRSKKLFALLVILVPLCSILLLWSAWNYSDMFKRRMTPVVSFLQGQAEEGVGSEARDFRPQTWMDTIDMIRSKPATGFGPGSYRYAFPEYRKRFKGTRIVTGHPHNEYLEVASEYGGVGFGLLALAWCWGLIRMLVFSLRTPNQHHAFMAMAFLGTAAGTLLHSFFDFQMHIFQNALLFSLLASIAAGPICGRQHEVLLKQGENGLRGKWLRPAGRMALAGLAVAGLLFSLQSFSSAFIRAAADRLVDGKKTEKAKRYYLRAIAIDPSNWHAYKGIGEVYFKERYYTLEPDEKHRLAQTEKEFFAKGYEHNPLDSSLVLDYGMAKIFLGDKETGLDLLKRAARLRPFNDMYWWRLGIEQRKAGQYDAALESFRYARTLKNSPLVQSNIKWLERQMAAESSPEIRPASKPEPDAVVQKEQPAQQKTPLKELHDLLDTR